MAFKMFLISALVLLSVLACDLANNDPDTSINPDCNYAGTCLETFSPFGNINRCGCCDSTDLPARQSYHYCGDSWVCDPNDPFPTCMVFEGTTCSDVVKYNYANFGFRALLNDDDRDPDITCSTDPQTRAEQNIFGYPSMDLSPQVAYVFKAAGYDAGIVASPCDTCTPAYPCTTGTDVNKNVTEGLTFGFQADYNEWYSPSCATGSLVLAREQLIDCDDNYDYGARANQAFVTVKNLEGELLDNLNLLLWSNASASNDYLGLGWSNSQMIFMTTNEFSESEEHLLRVTESPTNMPTPNPTISPTQIPTLTPTTNPTEMPTTTPTNMPTTTPTNMPTPMPTNIPTPTPTNIPTATPTQMPTQNPSSECTAYTNKVDDLSFVGVGSNCRGGLNSSYPGGYTCDSPYVICLPQENTPAAFVDQDYKSSTHRYSVDECLKECANDQRCSGIEFVADPASALGDCNLIDDIPVVITSMANTSFQYDSSISYTSLDNSVTMGDALCFQKEDYCNPYFEAEDLSEEMLNCYCPNNRKGFYTKKVKRTVENSRFCDDDTEVDTRIQKAQANRMFHLCENWCLFSTEDPEAESWYYNPWKACWRRQSAGSYCNRVIVSPDTIEMQFIRNRLELTCQQPVNASNENAQ